ncbi:MAG: class II glutamine amidotransferase [Flavobacteriales bacterium]|nr:class II glutamine amidotransferase [Flavobacteriales bacterium]
MSDPIKHECGIAFIRLLKPLEHYQEKYGTPLYGIKKLQLLMAKQINRGQDGAGIATIKLNPEYGKRYVARKRSNSRSALLEVFEEVNRSFSELDKSKIDDIAWFKQHFPYAGELLLGHLRYGTHGKNSIENIHPFFRQNNWMSRSLVLAGNYNLTNVDELFDVLINLGQHPKERSDNVTVLEKIGHFLDEENQRLFHQYREENLDNTEIAAKIKANLNMENVIKNAFRNLDGGFNMVGMVGDGNAFVVRDNVGIRPSFYYQNDEVFVVASERPAIMTAFNTSIDEVKELTPGNALIINREGSIKEVNILPPAEIKRCSFERIYFSRGSDADIYTERKELGRRLSRVILEKLDYDVRPVVFSYIPNTAATCFYGMIDGVYKFLDRYKREAILKLDNPSAEELDKILNIKICREKILVKDAKMRTFITQDKDRDDMVGDGYDVTYGVINKKRDTIVVVDDSIVRGTTLKKSILRILDRLSPRRIIVASSAPIIKYPDCYGIDMSRMNEFVAFRAMLKLLERSNQMHKLHEVYEACKEELKKPIAEMRNVVKDLYDLFSDQEISDEIARLVTPSDMKAQVEIVYQKVEDLHKACPNHIGDWYFTGNYPTPGGNKVVNKSFVFYMEGNNERAY